MARPAIRPARFGDIPAIAALVADAHQRSRYAAHPLNVKAAKALLMNGIQRHGGMVAGAQFVAVAEGEAGVEGLIVGLLQPIYFALEALEAIDIIWITRAGAHPTSGPKLLDAMHRWARKAPGLRSIRQGTTDAIADPSLTGRLLERRGMTLRGHIYEKEMP